MCQLPLKRCAQLLSSNSNHRLATLEFFAVNIKYFYNESILNKINYFTLYILNK